MYQYTNSIESTKMSSRCIPMMLARSRRSSAVTILEENRSSEEVGCFSHLSFRETRFGVFFASEGSERRRGQGTLMFWISALWEDAGSPVSSVYADLETSSLGTSDHVPIRFGLWTIRTVFARVTFCGEFRTVVATLIRFHLWNFPF